MTPERGANDAACPMTPERGANDAACLMTKETAVNALNAYNYSPFRMGTERTAELLDLMGNPQDRIRCIHVAGTNGKGSACAMMASVLRCAGMKVGVFTSPYLIDFSEQILMSEELPGEAAVLSAEEKHERAERRESERTHHLMPGFSKIPDGRLARLAETVLSYSEKMEDHPSTFEMTAAIAFQYFFEEKCDAAVIETGMGGLLDATNVIRKPSLCLLMKIGYEHTDYLGNTLAEIAEQKAGIMREGCPVAALKGSKEVEDVFRRKAAECGSELVFAGNDAERRLIPDFAGSDTPYMLGLRGINQHENASVVLAGIDLLRKEGWKIPENAVQEGLQNARLACRFETVSEDPLFVVDGAHNPQCTESMAENLRAYYPDLRFTFIVGVLADKDYRAMLQTIMPFAERFVTLTPQNPRALPAEALADLLREMGQEASAASSYDEALHIAFSGGGPVCAFGSLYMAGWLRERFFSFSGFGGAP